MIFYQKVKLKEMIFLQIIKRELTDNLDFNLTASWHKTTNDIEQKELNIINLSKDYKVDGFKKYTFILC